jgi:hypothetical protein
MLREYYTLLNISINRRRGFMVTCTKLFDVRRDPELADVVVNLPTSPEDF